MSIFSRLPNDIIMNIIKIETNRIMFDDHKIKFKPCMDELIKYHEVTEEQREEFEWEELYFEFLLYNIKYCVVA